MDTFSSPISKARRGQGKVDFLTLQDTFQKQINAGHTLINIYASSASKLSIGYTQFTKYVSRYCMTPDYKKITASQHQNLTTSPEHF
ncbi:TraK family protein [Pseudomonas sp. G(2018)]|uniref:TraK family protein n=1 Tax=Pseudomonas sp. G(2018) TaxID=2502242 RepID=UPI0010F7BC33|nr:TraK family protein [Pseudomonas sp. G(2018)]